MTPDEIVRQARRYLLADPGLWESLVSGDDEILKLVQGLLSHLDGGGWKRPQGPWIDHSRRHREDHMEVSFEFRRPDPDGGKCACVYCTPEADDYALEGVSRRRLIRLPPVPGAQAGQVVYLVDGAYTTRPRPDQVDQAVEVGRIEQVSEDYGPYVRV